MAIRVRLNENFLALRENYLFSEVGTRVREFAATHPDVRLLRLGIGDVSLPLAPTVTEAMHRAVSEMGTQEGFRGYAPEPGYDFLREALARRYQGFGTMIGAEDVWISDGAKNDAAALAELFGNAPVYLPDPTYPVYLDSNMLYGRRVRFLRGDAENGFLPMPSADMEPGALIYLCSPNNPTGAVYTRAMLESWVLHAEKSGSLLLFDAAYEAFIAPGSDLPHTIYAISGAERCAIELGSFSKCAGFTGVRCSWTVIPHTLMADGISFWRLWARRQATKTNGVSYVTQRGAEAALSEKGLREGATAIGLYRENAAILSDALRCAGVFFTGGVHAPYLFVRMSNGASAWESFSLLLEQTGIVSTPGSGFGAGGEGYLRFSAFASREVTREAAAKLSAFFEGKI